MTIADLISMLEKAEAGSRELDAKIARIFDLPACKEPDCSPDVLTRIIDRVERGEWDQDSSVSFYTTSLDAAVALVASQGFEWLKRSPSVFSVHRPLTEDQEARKEWGRHFEAVGATPAIALCLALLKALEARK